MVKAAYPDPAQFDPDSKYYDAKASTDNVRWYCVDVTWEQTFDEVVSLADLKAEKALKDMMVVQRGSRLSIQPVTKKEFETVLKMAAR